MGLEKIVKDEIRSLEFQKKNMIRKMEQSSELLHTKLQDGTISDLQLYACIEELNRVSKEYAFIQGRLISCENHLAQIEDVKS